MERLFIYCQANRATGGTELLHQLGYKIRLMGLQTYMVYYGVADGIDPVCETFKKYEVPYVPEVDDAPENVVIIPEIAIGLILKEKNAKRVLWWLSVDNAPLNDETIEILRRDNELIHFCQSFYAEHFVREIIGVEAERVKYLSDYVNSIFLVSDENRLERDNVVLFNPAKGFERTRDIIAKSDARIKWRALAGLTPEGMRAVMHTAKVYIDFGNHPGKDRIPREAALCGCRVITNRRGAAAYREDVEVDDALKFDEDVTPEIVVSEINFLLDKYDELGKLYEDYVRKTQNEFREFEVDVYKALIFLGFREIISDDEVDSEQYLCRMITCINNNEISKAYLLMVAYRVLGYTETEQYAVLETSLRQLIGESEEAYYCANEALNKYPENYELYRCLAEICITLGYTDKLKYAVDQMFKYARNTDDDFPGRGQG